MKYIYILLTFSFSVSLQSQGGYYRDYEFESRQGEEGYDLHILEDGYLIVGLTGCGDINCTLIMKTDFDGDTLWVKRYDDFYGHTRRTAISDSILYMPGEKRLPDGTTERDGYEIFRFDLEGEKVDSKKYDLSLLSNPEVDTIRRYAPFGNVILGDKVIMYGELYELNYGITTEVFSRGLMVWLDKNDLSYDTMIIVQPRLEELELWDAEVGSDSLLTLMVDDDAYISGAERDYRRFEKYDADAHKVWSSQHIELDNARVLYKNFHILSDGNIIAEYQDEDVYSDRLVSIGPDGNLDWDVAIDPRSNIDTRSVSAMAEASDGNILVGGNYFDAASQRRGSYVGKYSALSGEMIWERVFQDWTDTRSFEQRELPSRQWIWDLEVDAEDNIIATGFNNHLLTGGFFDDDVLLIKMDPQGCVREDCGGFEQTVQGTQKYYHMFNGAANWYFQHPEAAEGIYRAAFFGIYTSRDSMYQFVYRDWAMEMGEFGGYIGGTEDAWALLHIDNRGRQISIVEDTDTILLYDFAMEVGDVFESPYTPHSLEVIDSDTLIMLNGGKKQTLTLASPDHPEHTLTWMEGIGTDYGILWPPDFCNGDYGDIRLTCYYMFENLYYINEDIGGCRVTDTEDLYNAGFDLIQVAPNPTTDLVTITAPSYLPITRTEVMDTQGQTQLRHHDNSTQVVYDLSGYSSGLYFISVHTEKGSVVKKVVVE